MVSKNISEELDFDKTKPIRTQKPNPLPDRKALDDIIFSRRDAFADALGFQPKADPPLAIQAEREEVCAKEMTIPFCRLKFYL